jgi:flagellar hook-associated protein 3 FlgL
MAVDIREMLSHILSQANSQDGNGEYLFSGFKGRVQPFVGGPPFAYNGDMGQRELQISATRRLADRDNGFDVFMNVPTGAGSQNLFDTIEQIAADLDADISPAPRLADLDRAFAHMNQVIASIGGRLKSIETQTTVNDDFIMSLEISRASVEDIDYAETITLFSRQQIALEAAQKSFAQIQGLSLFNFVN